MRDTCNQSVKRGREASSSGLGEGEKEQMLQKKESSKRGMGLKTQERELREHLSS